DANDRHVGDQGHDDELQPDQCAGRGADDHVEVSPAGEFWHGVRGPGLPVEVGARQFAAYCSSLTCSSHSTTLPSSASWTAMWVMAVVGPAPCQCFSPGGNQTTSPGRISSTGPPHRWARPQPETTISVCPSGWVCQAVRAPGSNV